MLLGESIICSPGVSLLAVRKRGSGQWPQRGKVKLREELPPTRVIESLALYIQIIAELGDRRKQRSRDVNVSCRTRARTQPWATCTPTSTFALSSAWASPRRQDHHPVVLRELLVDKGVVRRKDDADLPGSHDEETDDSQAPGEKHQPDNHQLES
jgi:hypothetical protein